MKIPCKKGGSHGGAALFIICDLSCGKLSETGGLHRQSADPFAESAAIHFIEKIVDNNMHIDMYM